jgi:hypothetical protein
MLSKIQIKKINDLLRLRFVQRAGVFAVALLVIATVSYFGFRQNMASHAAGAGTLTVSPASGTLTTGSNVSVTLYANSGTDAVNAVQTSLTYDATKLQYVSMTEGTAFPTVAATSTGTAGTIRLARGTNVGTSVTGNNAIVTLTFKVLGSSGTTALTYDTDFSYLVRASDNVDVLGTATGASFTLKLPAPTVTAVSPTSGPTAGGTTITITGTNFVSGATVTVDGTAATGVTFVSATSITAKVPAHTAGGAVAVAVKNPDGQTATKTGAFTYIAPNPTVTGVSPASGTASGGTTVTISGTNLTTPTGVTFGGTAATSVTLVSATQITAVTPAHAVGAVDVTVNFGTGAPLPSVTLTSGYTYTTPPPTISSVSPASGVTTGGTKITISGTNFVNVTSVTVGGTAASGVTTVSPTSITANTPTHAAGAVSIVVSTATGTVTKTNAFTYNNPSPTISGVTPTSGTSSGGTVVTVSGSNFLNGATVTVGGNAATGVTFLSSTSLRFKAPAGTPGAASVVVTNPDGQKATLAASYTYLALGDANNDGRINALDLSALISHDGQNYPPCDFNGDGVVGSADLAILLGRWTW